LGVWHINTILPMSIFTMRHIGMTRSA
jgi:hypothetical protein